MKIELKEISVRELVEGYVNSDEEGVVGFSGALNIRPKYQREFVYKDAQRNAVIDTIRKNFPLNTMYWVKNGENDYEVLDGQQRTISICEYVKSKFSLDEKYFHNLTGDKKEQILNYRLMIYICEGDESEKLEWFRTINIAGEKLTDQELRNAVYAGSWLSDAKRRFSKTGCLAYQLGSKYLNGSPIRQDFLQTAIGWICNDDGDKAICEYMAKNRLESNADELWAYFNVAIEWVKMKFPHYRKEMKGVKWGFLYNKFKDAKLDATELEKRVSELMRDDEIGKKSGIYEYVLSGDERALNLCQFSDNLKREIYEKQGGICLHCKQKFEFERMEGDHIIPWSQGGKTTKENCQMLCRDCNRKKSNK